MRTRWITVAGVTAVGAVGAVAIAFAISYATGFGSKTQLTYLVDPLQRVHPELFRNDWLVAHTTAYHAAFGVVASWLFQLDDEGRISFFIVYVAVMAASYIAIYQLVSRVAHSYVMPVFAILAGWLAMTEGRALAGTYLWSGYFQPSSLATLGWLIAMVAYVRQRPLVTGLALAIAGAFHINFLVIGIGLFTLLELSAPTRDLRRLAWLLVPQLVVLVCFIPVLTASSSEPELALRVLSEFHAPGHYHPYRITFTGLSLVAWLGAAWALRPVAAGAAEPVAFARLWRLAWVGAVIALGMTAIVWIPQLRVLTRVFVWRLAPFAQLACQIVIVLGVCVAIAEPGRLRVLPWWRIGVACGSAIWIGISPYMTFPSLGYAAFVAIVVTLVLSQYVPAGLRQRATIVLGTIVCGLAIAHRHATLLHPRIDDAANNGLYTWAREHTDVDAVFAAPPTMVRLRLFGRRAIVADTWSPPLLPDELVAWYRRLCELVDLPEAATHEQVEQQYHRIPGQRLLEIARRFGASYVVVERGHGQSIEAPIAYENASYIAYRVVP